MFSFKRISSKRTILEKENSIEKLFARYLDNECSPAEVKVLLQHFGIKNDNGQLRKIIHEYMESSLEEEHSNISGMDALLNNVFNKIKETISKEKKEAPIHVMPDHKRTWYLVAASISVLLLSASAFFLFQHKKENQIIAAQNNAPLKNDIAPGRNNATLTLDNGTTIILDTAANGTLAQQGNTNVQKINGQIAYRKTDGTINAKPVYNTITTANGNQYQLVLADGSKVWLNAASSIRFPTSFVGNERKIEITGEAYFEVAHDASKPFKVELKSKAGANEEIEVLGTHFNVNSYLDEPEMKITLLEGSVRIGNREGVKTLVPGQQARITSNGIDIKNNVNTDQVVAWKNGYFIFDNTDIYTLMRQVARWYNVQVDFEGKVTRDGFSGKISRDVPLTKFIKVLELNDVKVNTEGRKITIGLENDKPK